jgi:hypothetical protein
MRRSNYYQSCVAAAEDLSRVCPAERHVRTGNLTDDGAALKVTACNRYGGPAFSRAGGWIQTNNCGSAVWSLGKCIRRPHDRHKYRYGNPTK